MANDQTKQNRKFVTISTEDKSTLLLIAADYVDVSTFQAVSIKPSLNFVMFSHPIYAEP